MKMKRMILAGCITLAALCCGNVTASAQQTDKIAVVEVQASSQREVLPDEITLSIIIKESDYKGKKTLQEQQQAMINVLKHNGIDYNEALSIQQMGSVVSYKIFSKTVRPRTQALYLLKLQDAGTMERIVQQLENEQISNITLVQTRYSKSDDLKIQLGVEAIKKAQVEARALANTLSQDIGKAVSINSWMTNNAHQTRYYRTRLTMAMAESADENQASDPTPSISNITYTVNVTVKFELK